MYSRQIKDNKKWCDMVDNKSQALVTDTVKYRNETETWG